MQSINFLIAATANILITVALSRVEAEQAISRASRLAAQLQVQSDSLELAVKVRTRELECEVAERKQALISLQAERDRAEAALLDLLAAQNDLVQAEKLASLGRLVAGAAHEVNTPIGVAVTMGSLLSDRFQEMAVRFRAGNLRRSEMDRHIAETEEGFGLLLSNLHRAADLVHSFRQVAADQIGEERRLFDLGGCLSDVVLTLGPVWRKPGHRVEVICQEPIEIDGYPGVMSQILTNLITNSAVHGYDPGQAGVLTVTAALSGAGMVELCYTDNGKGIAPEARDKVFEPFFTTRRSSGSTGLGLHIIYNLVVGKLGGTIDLQTQEGQGVRFTMRFPRVVG